MRAYKAKAMSSQHSAAEWTGAVRCSTGIYWNPQVSLEYGYGTAQIERLAVLLAVETDSNAAFR